MKPGILQNNDEQAYRIAYLVAGFIRKTLTEEEHDELDAWVVASEENTRLFEELISEESIEAGIRWHQQIDSEKALQKIKEEIGLRKAVKPLLVTIWPYIIAASLLAAVVLIFIFKPGSSKEDQDPALAIENQATGIKPGHSQAVLTMANGRTIILDSSATGILATEGNVTIIKTGEGEIVYKGNEKEMKYNMVSTPRGGQYKLVLGDGTQVWLNAESSIKFPAGFAPEHREVEIKGEAYFEVAENRSSPFRVHMTAPDGKEVLVEVLGTHFNINSYGDDHTITTTLIEGSVRIEKENRNLLLSPGQQVVIGTEMKIQKADTSEVMAWKDGWFIFRDAGIRSIGAQIARWYDIDVVYKGEISYHFNATVKRNESLYSLLKLLEGTKRVNFEMEGKKLVISP